MRPRFVIAVAITMLVQGMSMARADVRPHARMLRYPDVSESQIVFAYANDLWLVPRGGGMAVPLASPPGQETFPKFSPDGKTICFVGNYDGNRDLYTIAVDGGVPTRLTYHPDTENLCDWTPDGRLLFHYPALAGLRRQTQLFTISSAGGLPEKMPVPYGANGAVSPDGEWLAYTPHTIDNRTWKRYRGGMATDIWLFNLKNKSSKRMTDWEGTDSIPMWHEKTVYYLSDQGAEHRLNIWSYDTTRDRRDQVTTFKEDDVKWPSMGPGPAGKGEIVFQNGSSLYLLDLGTRASRPVDVTVPGDRPRIRPRSVDVSKLIASINISPTGKRALLEARGDVWTVPAEKGSARNLTRTAGAAEREPAWSPDARWIAYFCDASGEYELYIAGADGKTPPRQLTHDSATYYYAPAWSPDSKHIAWNDKSGAMWLHSIDDDKTTKFDTEPWDNQPRLNWSHDSAWIAYTKTGENRQSAIWLYHVKSGQAYQATSGRFNDTLPTFDRKGDYLYYASNRDFSSPAYEDIGNSFIYASTDRLLVVPLRDDAASPFAPKSDEDTPEAVAKSAASSQPASAPASQATSGPSSQATTTSATATSVPASQPDEKKPVVIDMKNFERRAVPIPIKRGVFSNLAIASDGKIIYTRAVAQGADGEPSIMLFDCADDKKEEKTILKGVGDFSISADGKKLLVHKDDKFAIVDATPDQKMEKTLATTGLTAQVDPRTEWRQIFTDAWRVERDFFYDPNMHGIDWKAAREHYGKMLEDCASREDVAYVISEMISELNVGHAYYNGGDLEQAASVSVGMLGCDFELRDGAYRISRICEAAPWDSDGRGPLSQPGVKVKTGDYLLAVNGVPLDTTRDPWAAFQGLAEKVVTLTISEGVKLDDKARDVIVELLPNETSLRFRSWVEKNRAYVESKTGGKVGYVYVPSTGIDGQNELFRQYYGQYDRQAIIVDERWNSGGQIPTRFIELLNRPMTNYWARRDRRDWPWPPDANPGPKCMLINGLAGSGGDAFPAYFRQAKLGKLIGTRTWGGLVGISGNPGLIDGGSVTAPTFAFYKLNGTWGIEGHGVDPDIEVIDDPAKMADGGDPQLDAAIALMVEELRTRPYVAPKRPAYPDRSGMGVRDEDR